jgi:quercetin dioxygenase-like cupin family protein
MTNDESPIAGHPLVIGNWSVDPGGVMSQHFFDPKGLKGKVIAPGTEIRVAYGDKIMLSFVELKPGGAVPMHSHPHEQGGICLEGAMEFTIGGETRTVRKGEGWMIPGGVLHSVRALETGAYALDVFYPHREEYK